MEYYDLKTMKYDKSRFLMGLPVVMEGEKAPDPLPENIKMCIYCDNLFDFNDPHQWNVVSTKNGFMLPSDIIICIECFESNAKQ